MKSLYSKASLFQHLVYTKTGSIDIGSISLAKIFSNTYGGLFLKGYEKRELQGYDEKYLEIFTRCIQDGSKYQVDSICFDDLNERMERLNNVPNNDIKFIIEHFL